MDEQEKTVKKLRKITLDLLLSCCSLTRYSKESTEAYLSRVTHLHLQGKRITTIKELEVCSNLKMLYLYDNSIDTIENLDFAKKLEQLFLNNNKIKEIPAVKFGDNLSILHLEDNEINFCTGLDLCSKLKELHISNQRLPESLSIEFDHVTLQALSGSLQVLDISKNNISNLNQFIILKNLKIFLGENNHVVDMSEVELIMNLKYLVEVSLIGNPVCSEFRYRDIALSAAGNYLEKYDNKPVFKFQQDALRSLTRHREKLEQLRKIDEI